MARHENKNSGFSHADFDELTRQLGMELKIEESTMLARSIQDGLYRNMRRLNGEVSDWGAKSGDFMVLLGVRAPSVLAEIGSISNRAEETKLRTPSYRENLAFFLEEGLVNYLRQYENDDESTAYAGQESNEGI
jgi:N-acetylmuramoyl-L-alanine amidase